MVKSNSDKRRRFNARCIASLCACILCGVQALAADEGNLYGLVHWDGQQTTNKGLASLPTDADKWTGAMEYVWKIPTYPYNYGGCHFEDKFYCNYLRVMGGYILEQKAYILDEKTGEELDVIQMPSAFDLYDGAYYEPEGVIYAFVNDLTTGTYGWAKVNPRTAQMEMVKAYPQTRLYGVAITDDGTAYGISGEGEVFSIDRTTGNLTSLFSHDDLKTKTEPKAHTSATWDVDNQRMVFAVCNLEKDGGSRLFSIDPLKKSVNLMYKLDGMGTQLASLYFDRVIKPGAPSAATELAVNFPSGSLNGTLSFIMPTTNFDGSTGQGAISYTVKIDGEYKIEKSANYGDKVNVALEVKEPGWHTFFVQCSNAEGAGQSAKLESFAGFEAPLAPSEVSARHYAGKMHLAWKSSPDTGQKGGPVNVGSIRYTILSNHGEKFITEQGATTYEYELSVPEAFTPYYYTITAGNDDGVSAPAKSNNVPLGMLKDTYTQDFTKEESQYEFTTLNSNNDEKMWEWAEEGCMVIRYNEQLAMDDYLTLPPMYMDYGDYYLFGFDAGTFNYEEQFEVKLADDYNQAGMDAATTVYGPVTLKAEEARKTSWSHHDVVVQAPDDNRFFLSIHGISPADRNVLFVDNVSLRKLAGGKVPAAVENLKATPDSKGALQVTLSGKLPAKDVAGNTLESVDYLKIKRNGVEIATVQLNGADSFSWTDKNAGQGVNDYIVIPGNSTGEGIESRCTAYAGFVNPRAPESCSVAYTNSTHDAVVFSWTPVTKDLNGLDVSDAVSYSVIRALDGDQQIVEAALKEPRYSDEFKSLKTPQFVQYATLATVNGLRGDMLVSPQVPVGPAYTLPLTEGFHPEIKMAYGLETNLTSEDSGLFTTNDTEKYQSADGDGGYGVFIGNRSGESATLYTAWIHIPQDAVEPIASIQYYGEGDAISNMIYIGACSSTDDSFSLLQDIETGGTGWQTATVGLEEYRGKDVRLAMKLETVGNTFLRFDNFRVYDPKAPGKTDLLGDDSFKVFTNDGVLSVRRAYDKQVMITRMDGMKMHRGEGDVTINLAAGVYLVTVGSETVKIAVQ